MTLPKDPLSDPALDTEWKIRLREEQLARMSSDRVWNWVWALYFVLAVMALFSGVALTSP